MPCRVGITTDPVRRKQEWEQKGSVRNWEILASGLTKNQAQDEENRIARERGCEAYPGGLDNGLSNWCVYYFEY